MSLCHSRVPFGFRTAGETGDQVLPAGDADDADTSTTFSRNEERGQPFSARGDCGIRKKYDMMDAAAAWNPPLQVGSAGHISLIHLLPAAIHGTRGKDTPPARGRPMFP